MRYWLFDAGSSPTAHREKPSCLLKHVVLHRRRPRKPSRYISPRGAIGLQQDTTRREEIHSEQLPMHATMSSPNLCTRAVRPAHPFCNLSVALTLIHSHVFVRLIVHRAANADAEVDGCPNEGEHGVEADAGVYLPTGFDLRHPEEQEPGDDDEHADPHQELDTEVRDLDRIPTSLRSKEDERKPYRSISGQYPSVSTLVLHDVA